MRGQVLLVVVVVVAAALASSAAARPQQPDYGQVEAAVLEAAAQPEQEESYQRVYDAFARLMQQTASGSLGNVRRLVSRLNRLVGPPTTAQPQVAAENDGKQQKQQQQQSVEERTEQILVRLDKVTRDTDQHTLAQLNEDISRLVGTLNEAYLRNLRRVIERVNKVVAGGQPLVQHQSGDRLQDELSGSRQPGFPGWDEFIGAVDRMQKNLAHFVRSSTRLVTGG